METGNKLTREQVFNDIIDRMNRSDNEDLCHIWESAFDFCIDARLKYDKATDLFEVWEETNLN